MDSTPSPTAQLDGIDPQLLRITHMEVYGMCCHSEVALVHKKLGVLPGVSHVRVNTVLRQVPVTARLRLARPVGHFSRLS